MNGENMKKGSYEKGVYEKGVRVLFIFRPNKTPDDFSPGVCFIGGGGGSRTRVRRRLTPGTTCLAHR